MKMTEQALYHLRKHPGRGAASPEAPRQEPAGLVRVRVRSAGLELRDRSRG